MAAERPVPVTLNGRCVRLVPLTTEHLDDLFAAGGGDDEVWRLLAPTPHSRDELGAELAELLDATRDGAFLPFAVIHRASGRAVGWTTYMDIDVPNESLEIGWTWYGRAYWRSAVNTETKLLLLTHAFEELGMGRVQFKTDHMNQRSQDAITRLGARREGVLRRHRRRHDGTWRDSVYFSLLAQEWPDARARLSTRLRAGEGVPAAGEAAPDCR